MDSSCQTTSLHAFSSLSNIFCPAGDACFGLMGKRVVGNHKYMSVSFLGQAQTDTCAQAITLGIEHHNPTLQRQK